MKTILQFTFLFIFLNSFAQTKFEKGYFINNTNQKIDCLIKNYDWKNNPTQFEYKITENSPVSSLTINEVKEFSIDGESKFMRQNIDIDFSSDNLNNYSKIKDPEFKNKLIFIKVLVEGINNLYIYEGENIVRMFFSNKNNPIQQLIYKKYYDSSKPNEYSQPSILINDNYKRQLYANVNCDKNQNSTIENLEYKRTQLIDYFMSINSCLGDTKTKQTSINKKMEINFKPLLSFNSSSMELNPKIGSLRNTNYETQNKINLGVGFEVEFILPFFHNNWSLLFEPTYVSSYKSSSIISTPQFADPNTNLDATFNYFQIPIGARRYFYLNENSKIYINAALNLTFANSSSEIQIAKDDTIDLSGDRKNFAFGLGYKYKNYYIEIRKYSDLELNSYNNDSSYKFKNITFNLMYKLF